MHLLFSNNYWIVPIFHPNPSQIKGGFMLSQYVSCIEKRLLGDCKSNPLIIVQLLLEHLPIPVIKKIIEKLMETL